MSELSDCAQCLKVKLFRKVTLEIYSVAAGLLLHGRQKSLWKSKSSVTQKCYDRRGRARTNLDIWPDQQLPYDHSNSHETIQSFQTAKWLSRPTAIWKWPALQTMWARCRVTHTRWLLNEHVVRVFLYSRAVFSLRLWSQSGQGPVGLRGPFVHWLMSPYWLMQTYKHKFIFWETLSWVFAWSHIFWLP